MSVSILIPLYNGIELLNESLTSILNQTYTSWEVIIGVNGHDSESYTYQEAVRLSQQSSKIRVMIYQKPKGKRLNYKSTTLNQMILDVSHDIICLLDVDDIWENTKLEAQMKIWVLNKYDLVSTRGDTSDDKTGSILDNLHGDISDIDMTLVNPIINSSVMIRKRDAFWLEKDITYEDYEMWFRFRHLGKKMFIVNEILCHHRIHKSSFFNTQIDVRQNLLDIWRNIHPVTIVTAYFQIPSKFNNDKYMSWIENFLRNIPCCMYIYTDASSSDILMKFREKFMDRTKIIVMDFGYLRMAKLGKNNQIWEEQYKLDHEKYHTKELYIIWNEKTEFVRKSIEDNIFKSDYFFWCDIGAFRDASKVSDLINFPNPSKVYSLNKEKIHILEIEPIQDYERILNEEGYPEKSFQGKCRCGGGIFGGHTDAWKWWSMAYYSTLSKFINMGRFAGKDQDIMSSVAVMYPKKVKFIKHRPYFNREGDKWFYMQYFLK